VNDLRDYQKQAVDAIERTSRAIYVLPTGGGPR
jgi:superfamily II DNA or RNA helicase